jgi:hypothetical protein
VGVQIKKHDSSPDTGEPMMQQPEAVGKEPAQVRESAKEKRKQASRLTDIELNEILNAILDDFIK